MNCATLARDLAALKRDAKPDFRESFRLSSGETRVVRSTGERDWWEQFTEALAKGHLRPDEFSLRDLFESLVADGRELVRSWAPQYGPEGGISLREAAGAITSSDFSDITGQIVYTRLIQDLTPESYPFSALIPTQSSPYSKGEKIAGIQMLGDQAQIVEENEDYPLAGVGQDWIEAPETTKRGFIVPVTREAIFEDRTGDVLRKAGEVGAALALNKEKRAVDCVIDENTTAHRHNWRGTTYATYQTTTPWDNVTASNALVNDTDIDNAQQTLNNILDPNTGEPVVVEGDTLICTQANELKARSIQNATQVTRVTASGENELASASQLPPFQVVTSRQLAQRMATDTDWYFGKPSEAFVYMENWPITVTQAPANSEADFRRDIVAQFKCSEKGQYFVMQPRKMTKCTA